MSLEKLRNKSGSNFEKLQKELAKINTKTSYDNDDERYWKLKVDSSDNGFAIIRFLPDPDDEALPYVQMFEHSFQDIGGWYIEKSLTTIDKPDPCGEENSRLWAQGEAGQAIARKRKRKMSYHSNILVIKDSLHPENEGKVFLFKYGKQIFDFINDKMNPEFEDETPVNPFDLWTGANFRLKRRMSDKYPTYDKSAFDEPSVITDDEDKLKEIYDSLYSLAPIVDVSNFKTYEKLKERLDKVTGKTTGNSIEDDDLEEEKEPELEKEDSPTLVVESDEDDDDGEDSIDFFKTLVED